MKFVFTNDPGTIGKPHLPERKYLPEGAEAVIADFLPEGDNEEFYRKLADADAVLNSYVYLGKKEIDSMQKCKCISFQSTGYNEVDLDYAAQKGIPVTSILDYCTQETAENAIAMMLCLQRSTLGYNKLIQEDHVWNVKAILHQQRVEGQVMGIVGLDMLESEFPDAEYLARSPLVGRSDVILNPHSGYQSDTSLELIYKISMENAIKCIEGRYEDCWVIRNGVGIGGKYIR